VPEESKKFQLAARAIDPDEIDREEMLRQAKRHGISLNTLIVRAVRDYVEKLKKKEAI
jgi:predicted HicB family RNase H-like nuclease